MQATLNVRMDGFVKERGDQVLRAHGVSTSAAVRALWEHLAATKELPEFLKEREGGADARRSKRAALLSLGGIAEGACSRLSDEEMSKLYASRYE